VSAAGGSRLPAPARAADLRPWPNLVIRCSSATAPAGRPCAATGGGQQADRGRRTGGGAWRSSSTGQGWCSRPASSTSIHYDYASSSGTVGGPSPWHGVTTIVMGNCGFTIAPCRESDRETLMRLLLFVEGMPLETLRAGLVWSWEDYGGYLGALESRGVGPNVASFIGHSAIRFRVMVRAAVERTATAGERAAMARWSGMRWRRARRLIDVALADPLLWRDSMRHRAGSPVKGLLARSVLREVGRGVIELAPRGTMGRPRRNRPSNDRSRPWRARAAASSPGRRCIGPFAPGRRRISPGGRAQAQGHGRAPGGLSAARGRFSFAAPPSASSSSFGGRPSPNRGPSAASSRPAFRTELALHGVRRRAGAQLGSCRLSTAPPKHDGGRTRRWPNRRAGRRAAAHAFCDLVLGDDRTSRTPFS
jgi:hypothetical protein